MDLSFLQYMIPDIASRVGVDPATLLLWVLMLSTGANLAGRLIPDDAEGWLGRVRSTCKILGAYAQNRVSRGVKTNDVVKEIVAHQVVPIATHGVRPLDDLSDAVADAGEVLETTHDQIVEAVSDPFDKFAQRILEAKKESNHEG